jgi:hypothetical protein
MFPISRKLNGFAEDFAKMRQNFLSLTTRNSFVLSANSLPIAPVRVSSLRVVEELNWTLVRGGRGLGESGVNYWGCNDHPCGLVSRPGGQRSLALVGWNCLDGFRLRTAAPRAPA